MEQLLVFAAHQAPDDALSHLEQGLVQRGFETEPGSRYDLVARATLEHLFVGLAPHPDGLVARVKAKGMVPGRAERAIDTVAGLLAERLGMPVDRFDPSEVETS